MVSKAPLEQPALNSLGWNTPLNSNFAILTDALGQITTTSVTSTDVTLTAAQAQKAGLIVSGSMTGSRTLFLPQGVSGMWFLMVSTSGGSLTIASNNGSGVAAGAAFSPLSGYRYMIWSDGTNVYNATNEPSVWPGTIIKFGGLTPPPGYFWCDGTAYSRSTYSGLFTAIGTTWGGGDGSTTFNVPDMRGYFPRGSGTNSDGTVGTAVGATQADAYLNHSHGVTDPGHAHTFQGGYNTTQGTTGGGSVLYPTTLTTNSATTGITVNTSTTGGNETRPKNKGVLFCIKY